MGVIECALDEEDERLLPQHFLDAYAMQEGCDIELNVFDSPNLMEIPLDVGADEYEFARSKCLKKKMERG
ncbi:hypothetical protein [Aliiruegeria sabulilitoris]|uniref:hypothetical protein n=1 Tax=Aliiruegeria sabulilitoris TaxID=1510458 RepID=UPI00082D9DDB|nr:hypothetical protein [Aliiruegeria sabulilitoris]NDR58679.1 hypothetical protein [Pseudoruegeria sp. M32A2M]